MKRLITMLIFVAAIVTLTACGNSSSGGDVGSPPANPGSSNWDELVWDQDDWA